METIKNIAAEFGKTREHFSREYGSKAAVVLVTEFRRIKDGQFG